MKPRTKLEKKVAELSSKLPDITDTQKAYPYKHLFKELGYYWKKGEVWCQCCGHIEQVLQPILAVSLDVGSHLCPNCGTNLHLEHWNQTNRQYSNECIQYSVVQSFKDWMVVRTFDVKRNNTRGRSTELFMSEIYQNWISEDGKEIIMGKKYTRSPFHFSWCYNTEMDIKYHNGHCNGYYEMQDVFNVTNNYIYPKLNVTPLLKRNGWTNKLLKLSKVSIVSCIQQLLKNPVAEMIVKTGQLSVFEYMLLRGNYTLQFRHALNICNRNGYKIKDASMWFDYLDLLSHFNLDTHNAHYVCPKDLKAEHDKLMVRKQRTERKKKLEDQLKEAAKWEEQYKKNKGKFFGICFGDNDIVITVLQSVSEFVEEADAMHHCVYSNRYFNKSDSLILSAKEKEGKRIETIEISLKTLNIVQSRGVCNQNTQYHDRIIGLVKKNIGLIRNKLSA